MLPAGRIRAPRLKQPGQGRDTQVGGVVLRSAVEFRQVSRNPFVTGAVEPPFPYLPPAVAGIANRTSLPPPPVDGSQTGWRGGLDGAPPRHFPRPGSVAIPR